MDGALEEATDVEGGLKGIKKIALQNAILITRLYTIIHHNIFYNLIH